MFAGKILTLHFKLRTIKPKEVGRSVILLSGLT